MASWDAKFEELRAYKDANGDCNVPQRYEENKSLSYFVHKMRREYKKHQQGEDSSLTNEQIKSLNDLGFAWVLRNSGKRTSLPWHVRMEDLKEFKRVHGHCRVPQSYEANRPLRNWVSNLRRQYKKIQQGEKSSLEEEQIAELNNLGFEWTGLRSNTETTDSSIRDLPDGGASDDNSQSVQASRGESATETDTKQSKRRQSHLKKCTWETRLGELKEFKRVHGHCRVPQGYAEHRPLANWVSYQRTQYAKLQKGEKSPMTAERIAELNELEFEWKVHSSTSKTTESDASKIPDGGASNGDSQDPQTQHEELATETDTNKSKRPQRHQKPSSADENQSKAKKQRTSQDEDSSDSDSSISYIEDENKKQQSEMEATEPLKKPQRDGPKLSLGERLKARFEARLKVVSL